MLLVVALVALSNGVSPARADADITLPTLVSFARTSPDTAGPGDTISISYEAHDTGAGLASVGFEFHDPTGTRVVAFAQKPLPDSGVASGLVPANTASGALTLFSISVWDQASNLSTYYPDGQVGKTPQDAIGASRHTMDFTAADLTVVNPQQDLVAPTLRSLERTTTATPAAGDTVRIAFDGVDDRSDGLDYAHFRFVGPAGEMNTDLAQYFDTSSPAGEAKWTIRTQAPSGVYRLTEVELWDQAQNHVTYKRDGSVVGDPNVAYAASHHLDFAALDLQIDNPNGDLVAPVLRSVARTSPMIVKAGEEVTLDWSGFDASGMSCISVWIEGPIGNSLSGKGGLCPEMPVRIVIPATAPTGIYRLKRFYLYDRAGYRSQYTRDGDVETWPEGVSGPTSHKLAFALADFWVDNGPPLVVNAPPTPVFGKFVQQPGHWVFVNGTPSDDADGYVTKYEWRWGDGSSPSSSPFGWHQYKKSGWYLIRLTATDNLGAATTRGIWFHTS